MMFAIWLNQALQVGRKFLIPMVASVEDAYQKVAYDLFYIKNYSLFLDFAIALKTLRVVVLGKGR